MAALSLALSAPAHAQLGAAMDAVSGAGATSEPETSSVSGSGSLSSSSDHARHEHSGSHHRTSSSQLARDVEAVEAVIDAIFQSVLWSSWYRTDASGAISIRANRFRDVPFAGGNGIYLGDDEVGGQPVLGSFTLEGGVLLQGGARGRANVRLMLPIGFDLEADYLVFGAPARDAVASIGEAANGTQLVQIGTLRGAYRLVDADILQFRVGAGARMWADNQNPIRFGPTVYAGMDIFLSDVVILSVDAAGSAIGDAQILDARAALGVVHQGFEIRAGYEHTAVDSTKGRRGAQLGGPFIGTRLWW